MSLGFMDLMPRTAPSCSSPIESCTNTTAVANLCCFNYPGGQFVQTQFWDTNPPTGPSNSWTVHGLWPDHCDGTYDATCDSKRQYTNITQILQSYGKTDLLNYMSIYYKDYQGNDESFWEHEWGKHGTCISTLEPKCYTNYQPQEEVVDYFQQIINLFKPLTTYDWLANAGIVPSTTQTYTSAAINAALKSNFGYDVIIQCSSGALDEVWYGYRVKGSVANGQFIAAAPDGTKSNCPASGIKYLPKSGSAAPTTTMKTSTTSGTAPASTATGSFSGKGYLNANSGGCLISAGTWYSSGTCATYTAAAGSDSSSFTLTSSKGACGLSSSKAFVCASGTTATSFKAVNGNLGYVGSDGKTSTVFGAAATPTGSTQQTVYATPSSVAVAFSWQSV